MLPRARGFGGQGTGNRHGLRDDGGMQVRRGDGRVIAVGVAGQPGGTPVLFSHGLADSRLSAQQFTEAARDLGLRLVAPDRPGIGRTDPRRLRRLADWAEDAALVLDAVDTGPVALLGVSAGGPFAAACAARLDGRVRSLTLVSALGPPGWPTRGMAPGQRLALQAARHVPAFGGWLLGRLAALARRRAGLFLRLATSELPGIDRRALAQPGRREAFLAGYAEAFRRGSRGVAQDLRVLTRPWGFELGSIAVPASIHHGTPIPRFRPGTPGSWPRPSRARSFTFTPATGTSPSSAPPGRCCRPLPHITARGGLGRPGPAPRQLHPGRARSCAARPGTVPRGMTPPTIAPRPGPAQSTAREATQARSHAPS
jgi:pimeloyl-ACP methyl ester carboxylesterase